VRYLFGFSYNFFDLKKAGQQCCIVVYETLLDQSTEFEPDRLFIFSLEPQFAKIDTGNGSAQLMTAFSAIHRLMDILPQGQGIDIVKKLDRMKNIIQFPRSLLGVVLACVRT